MSLPVEQLPQYRNFIQHDGCIISGVRNDKDFYLIYGVYRGMDRMWLFKGINNVQMFDLKVEVNRPKDLKNIYINFLEIDFSNAPDHGFDPEIIKYITDLIEYS